MPLRNGENYIGNKTPKLGLKLRVGHSHMQFKAGKRPTRGGKVPKASVLKMRVTGRGNGENSTEYLYELRPARNAGRTKRGEVSLKNEVGERKRSGRDINNGNDDEKLGGGVEDEFLDEGPIEIEEHT